MNPIGLEEVLRDPHGIAKRLLGADLYGLTEVEVRAADATTVVFWMTLEPWAEMAELGYPTERVSVIVQADRSIRTVPHNDQRPWLHRFPTVLGELCLWDPWDPAALQWDWAHGLIDYITIAHRHLQAEEYWRRHGTWPAEDAPHGDGPHPIRSLPMRWAAGKEQR